MLFIVNYHLPKTVIWVRREQFAIVVIKNKLHFLVRLLYYRFELPCAVEFASFKIAVEIRVSGTRASG